MADQTRQLEAMPFCWALCLALSLVGSVIKRKDAVSCTMMVLTSALFLGALSMSLDWHSKSVSLPKGKVRYTAVVKSPPSHGTKRQNCDLVTTSFSREYKLKAYILSTSTLHEGDTICCTSIWNEPKNFFTSPNFDYALYLKRHGYAATTFINDNENQNQNENSATVPSPIGEVLNNGNQQPPQLTTQKPKLKTQNPNISTLRSKLLFYLRPEGSDSVASQDAAIIGAMVLGDKSQLSAQTRNDYSAAGVSHVLALSGLHISILLGILSLLLMHFNSWLSALIKLFFVWGFAFLVGMPVSLLRVAVMFTIIIIARAANRDSNTLNTLFTAAFAILLFSPQSLYDVGFQLSFTAVFSILLAIQLTEDRMGKAMRGGNRIVIFLANTLLVSFAAQVGTLPLVLYHFGQFPTYFLLSNIFIGLFATAVLSLSVITLLVALVNGAVSMVLPDISFIATLYHCCQRALGIIASWMNGFVHFISSLPCSTVHDCYITLPQVFFIYMFIGLLVLAPWRRMLRVE